MKKNSLALSTKIKQVPISDWWAAAQPLLKASGKAVHQRANKAIAAAQPLMKDSGKALHQGASKAITAASALIPESKAVLDSLNMWLRDLIEVYYKESSKKDLDISVIERQSRTFTIVVLSDIATTKYRINKLDQALLLAAFIIICCGMPQNNESVYDLDSRIEIQVPMTRSFHLLYTHFILKERNMTTEAVRKLAETIERESQKGLKMNQNPTGGMMGDDSDDSEEEEEEE